MYDVKSLKAEEFINDEEIQETLKYARENIKIEILILFQMKKQDQLQV